MQDSSNHKFDPSFVEASWQDMEKMLNEALPIVPKPQTNKRILTLMALLLVISCFISAYYGIKYHSMVPTTTMTKETKVIQTVYLNSEATQSSTHSGSTRESLTQIKPYTDIKNEKSIAQNNSKNLYKRPSKALSYTQKQSTTRLNPTAPPFTHDFESIIKQQSQSSQDLAADNRVMDKSLSNSNEAISVKQLKPLPGRHSLLSKKESNQEILTMVDIWIESITPEEKKRSIQYNFGVMAMASTDRDYTGLGVSSSVTVPFGNKFGFRTGLAINYLDREHYFISNFDRSLEPTLITKSNGEKYFLGLKQLKQVYLPLSLNYNLTPSLAFNSGVNLRYTYSSSIDESLTLPPSRNSRRPIETSASLFNNANLGVSAGFQYRFGPKFSLLIDSEWGMSSLINRAQFTDPGQLNYDLNIINLTTNYSF